MVAAAAAVRVSKLCLIEVRGTIARRRPHCPWPLYRSNKPLHRARLLAPVLQTLQGRVIRFKRGQACKVHRVELRDLGLLG